LILAIIFSTQSELNKAKITLRILGLHQDNIEIFSTTKAFILNKAYK